MREGSVAVDVANDFSLVEDDGAAHEFLAVPRSEAGRVTLHVGRERLELNRWGTLLATGLVAGTPNLGRIVRRLRPRRMKRPRLPATGLVEAMAPSSTADIAPPLNDAAATGARLKPDRATRRARRRVRKYATNPSQIATDSVAAAAFLERALATPDPVVAAYGDQKVTFTAEGSRAVLGLFCTGRLRLALVHVWLGADRYRPTRTESEPPEPVDPADTWGPFPVSLSFAIRDFT